MALSDIRREVAKWRSLVWGILDPENAASGEVLTADGSGGASYQPGGGGSGGLPDGYYNARVAINSGDAEHDIDFTGKVRDAADSADLAFSGTLTKQLDVNWVAGNNQGGKASAVVLSAGLTVHMFAIGDGVNVDAGFDTSLTATNLLADATGYTTYRRVASMVLDASSNWTEFIQRANDFILNVAGIPSTSDNSPGTGVNTYTLTEIPDGIEVKVYLVAQMLRNANNAAGHWFETDLDNMSVTGTAPYEKRVRASSDAASVAVEVWSNTSRQVSYQQDDANPDIRYGVVGWMDPFDSVVIGGSGVSNVIGSWEPIETVTLDGTETNLDLTWDETIYSDIRIVVDGIQPQTDGVTLRLRVGHNDGGTIVTTGYDGNQFLWEGVAHTNYAVSDRVDELVSCSNAANETVSGTIEVKGGRSADTGVLVHSQWQYINNGSNQRAIENKTYMDDGENYAVDTIRLFFASGNFAAQGQITVFGLRRDGTQLDSSVAVTSGSWTPLISDGTNDATMTSQTGRWRRIGDLVFITCEFVVNSAAGVGANVRVTGLPFTSLNVNSAFDFALAVSEPQSLALAADRVVTAHVENNTDYIRLWAWDSSGATGNSFAMTGSQVSSNGAMKISGHYIAAP